MTTFATLPPGLNPMSLFDGFLQLNAAGQISLTALTGTTGCSLRQWRAALAANTDLDFVFSTIAADINDSVNIQWNSGLFVFQGDALWTATQTALIAKYGAYTNAQMLSLLAQAQALPF